MDASTVSPLISAFVGAVAGGLISLYSTRYSLSRTFDHQIAVEKLREQQRLFAEEAARKREADALRRRMTRSLERLFDSSRFTASVRPNIGVWGDAAAVFIKLLDREDADSVLLPGEYTAFWSVANESRILLRLLTVQAQNAEAGQTTDSIWVQLSLDLYFHAMADALLAVSKTEASTEAAEMGDQDFTGYPAFSDRGNPFIPVRLKVKPQTSDDNS